MKIKRFRQGTAAHQGWLFLPTLAVLPKRP